MADSAKYRAKAAELREKIKTARDQAAREELGRLAQEYDHLAEAFEALEAMEKKPTKP